MKKLRAGVVGTGNIFRSCHLPAMLKNTQLELIALCDIIKEKATKIAEEYGIEHVYSNYSDLIDRKDIDAVFVSTPNYLHSIIAVEALKKCKNVFTEKPDAVNVDEVLKMQKAAEESGKLLMVMRNNRFRKESQHLKKYIDQGNLGEIYAARCGWVRRRGIPGRGGWFTTKEQSGGGPLIDLGVHMIDLALWLMGNPRPISVTGSTYCKFANNTAQSDSVNSTFGEQKENGIFDVEDLAMGFIKFDNGSCLSTEFSWASNIEGEKNFVELMGTKAGAKLQDSEYVIFTESLGNPANLKPLINKNSNEVGAHGKNINHFVDCILNGTKPLFTPQQGVDMIKILTAIYKSAETGREVLL